MKYKRFDLGRTCKIRQTISKIYDQSKLAKRNTAEVLENHYNNFRALKTKNEIKIL